MGAAALWALVPKWLVAVLLAAALALAAANAGRLHVAKKALSEVTVTLQTERATRAVEDKQRAEIAALASERFRKAEILAFNRAQENDLALQKALTARRNTRSAELVDHNRLHNDIQAYLAAARHSGSETCAADLTAERDRSATLGRLFEEADGLAGELADAAERHAAEARAAKRQLELDREVNGEQK